LSPWLNNIGTHLPPVTEDIDGELRDIPTPDIGADEYTPPATTPLSGSYTIGSGGDYLTFAEAIDDLIKSGISAAVTFNIISGSYTEHFTLISIPGASSTNTITFQSQSGKPADVILTYAATNSDSNFVIKLLGSDYVTFQNMTVSATGTNYARIFYLIGGLNEIKIANNILKGIPSRDYAIYTYNSFLKNFEISGNTFNDGDYGIYSDGLFNQPSSGTQIMNNIFNNQSESSIQLDSHIAPIVEKNTIIGSNIGIYLYNCGNNLKIQKNKISNCIKKGIELFRCFSEASMEGIVANNFVQVGEGLNNAIGISLVNSSFQNIYFNSVNLTSTDSEQGRAFYISSGESSNVVNNVFVNTGGGYAYYYTDQANKAISNSDHNDIYSTGVMLAYWNNDQENLLTLQTVSGKDNNSVSIDPKFESLSDLHVSAQAINNIGTPIASVTDDIDDEPRDATQPDIGADEFTPSEPVDPLSGTYTIGVGGDYLNFIEAVFDLKAKVFQDLLFLMFLLEFTMNR